MLNLGSERCIWVWFDYVHERVRRQQNTQNQGREDLTDNAVLRQLALDCRNFFLCGLVVTMIEPSLLIGVPFYVSDTCHIRTSKELSN